jgi:hypothetical protein
LNVAVRRAAGTIALACLACLACLALGAPGSTRAAARAPRFGYLRIVIRNVPAGTSAHVVLTGPRRYRLVLEHSRRLRLEAGTYRLASPAIHGSTFDAAPVRAAQRVVVPAGKEVVSTVTYLAPAPRTAPAQPPGTAPAVTAVTVTAAAPAPLYVWIGVTFTDPECDVVGGTWIGAGEAIGDFGKWGRPDLMRNLSCVDGVGALEFARTCTVAQSVERVLLVDATGRRSTAVGYTLRCS